MVFGRLYHDLNPKYERREPGRPTNSFFAPRLGTETHCMNWPLLIGVVGRMWEERRRNRSR